MSSEKKETPPTQWGWGRKAPPPSEVLAWAQFPWILIYILWVVVPFFIAYKITTSLFPFLFLFLVFGLVLALPIMAGALFLHSHLVHPPAKGNPEEFFVFEDKEFEAKYRGQKIPLEHLYEAYFNKKVSLREGKDLLEVLYQRHLYSRPVLVWEHVRFFLQQFIPELLSHTRKQDITQVRGHYDRGDDFYNAFLGETMIYTSGVFHNENDTLEEAQKNKMELVCQKVHMKSGDRHLDIGCGWGTFISYAAKNYQTDSTGVTLGKNQYEWANRKAKENGVSERARAICADYRDIPQLTKNAKFDKITCLEMAEHVGVKYFNSFLLQVKDMLEDDGMFYLQIAGLRRAWQFDDFNWGLFMGKYIFPGADASCPLGWVINQLEGAGFEVRSSETIGIHYSATIKRWYDNWLKNKSTIEEKYGVWWYRLWEWFLAWSVISPEHGFASCYQIVAHKNEQKFDRKQFIAERAKWKI